MHRSRYSTWGQFLKSHRQKRFRSAREFCSEVEVGISYPQYSRYEAGDQLPSLEQALEIYRFLRVPTLEGVLEWTRVQMPAGSEIQPLETLIEEVRVHGGPRPMETSPVAHSPRPLPGPSLDDVIVFNRAHLRLFAADLAYRDLFTVVNSFAPRAMSAIELGQVLGVTETRAATMATELADLGVVLWQNGRAKAAKPTFYFPEDEEFFELRNQNLIHNASKILAKLNHSELAGKRAYRGLITRELTESQLAEIIGGMETLVKQVAHLPETDNPERVYSLCMLLGERFARPKSSAPGLRREPESGPVARNLDSPGVHA